MFILSLSPSPPSPPPLQCGAGLQTAGGQAAASNEEAVPARGVWFPPAALPPGGLHLHAQTQVQSRLQEAPALETLVPLSHRERDGEEEELKGGGGSVHGVDAPPTVPVPPSPPGDDTCPDQQQQRQRRSPENPRLGDYTCPDQQW